MFKWIFLIFSSFHLFVILFSFLDILKNFCWVYQKGRAGALCGGLTVATFASSASPWQCLLLSVRGVSGQMPPSHSKAKTTYLQQGEQEAIAWMWMVGERPWKLPLNRLSSKPLISAHTLYMLVPRCLVLLTPKAVGQSIAWLTRVAKAKAWL